MFARLNCHGPAHRLLTYLLLVSDPSHDPMKAAARGSQGHRRGRSQGQGQGRGAAPGEEKQGGPRTRAAAAAPAVAPRVARQASRAKDVRPRGKNGLARHRRDPPARGPFHHRRPGQSLVATQRAGLLGRAGRFCRGHGGNREPPLAGACGAHALPRCRGVPRARPRGHACSRRFPAHRRRPLAGTPLSSPLFRRISSRLF